MSYVPAAPGAVAMEGAHVALADEPAGGDEVYLGRYGGVDYVASTAEPDAPTLVHLRTALRELEERLAGAEAPDRDDALAHRELAVTAVAMVTWHSRNQFCGGCGARTDSQQLGWSRRCPSCGTEHYPRTDPAVIVAITDVDDRLLLAHVSYHSPRRYSHLAGYVEPGESLEQAAHREVFEEAQLTLSSLEHVGSQPWPFPASVMVAFRAVAADTEIQVDGEEVTDARWFTRPQLAAAVADGTVLLAPPGSIASRLIHDWYGDALPGADDVASA